MTISPETLMWAIGIILTGFGALISVVWYMLNRSTDNAISGLHDYVDNISEDTEKKITQFRREMETLRSDSVKMCGDLDKKIEDDRKENSRKKEEMAKRIFDKTDELQKTFNQLEVTVVGFRGVFVAKQDFDNKVDKLQGSIERILRKE